MIAYYGCIGGIGHYWWLQDGSKMRNVHPWPMDGIEVPEGLCGDATLRSDPQTEGCAHLHYMNDSTYLAFWDRSVDKRKNSVSVFCIPGHYTFDEAVDLARDAFPRVWQRYKYSVVLATTITQEPKK